MLFRCGLCPDVFPSKFFVDQHKFRDHKGRSFMPKYKSTVSEESDPIDPKNFRVCEVCGKEINSWGYKKHLSNHSRPKNEKLPCPHCPGKTFASASSLACHLKAHICPLQCELCGFATASNLAEHQNIHTNSRPFKCKLCTADFNSKGNMHAHIRQSHKGIKRKK